MRAAQPDLLLHGADAVDGDVQLAFGEAAHGFGDDERADLVIHPFGHEAVFVQAAEIGLHRDRVADRDQLFGFGLVFRADVDPHVGKFRRGVALGGFEQVDRLLADHAVDAAFFGQDLHLGGGDVQLVDAAVGADVEQSLVGDVDHLETDFVIVPGQHHLHRRGGVQHGHGVAEHVGPDLVAAGFEVVAEDRRRLLLEAGGAGGIHKLFEKLET